MRTVTTTQPIVLDAVDIDRIALTPLPQIGHGVSHRILCEGPEGVTGLMHLAPEGRVDPHAHEHASHDIWVVEGTCEVLGRHLLPRSLVHVPPGVDHDIVAGPEGCTLLYFYRASRTSEGSEPCE